MALWSLRFFRSASDLTPSRVRYVETGAEADAARVAANDMLDEEQTVEISRVLHRHGLEIPAELRLEGPRLFPRPKSSAR
jgi:hypothetical protein